LLASPVPRIVLTRKIIMMHEIYVWLLMFFAMPEWIIASVFFTFIALTMWFTTKINVSK